MKLAYNECKIAMSKVAAVSMLQGTVATKKARTIDQSKTDAPNR